MIKLTNMTHVIQVHFRPGDAFMYVGGLLSEYRFSFCCSQQNLVSMMNVILSRGVNINKYHSFIYCYNYFPRFDHVPTRICVELDIPRIFNFIWSSVYSHSGYQYLGDTYHCISNIFPHIAFSIAEELPVHR